MKKILLASIALAFILPVTDAEARKRVRIYKPSPTPPPVVSQPIYYPMAVVPPVLVAFDWIRRTSCDPKIAVSTGKGDPGFDLVNGPLYGNFLVPAIYRKECLNQPQPNR